MKKLIIIMLSALMLVVTTFTFTGCSKNDKLYVATNAAFAPFEFVEGGKFVGIDMEIAKILADEMGFKLEIKDMEFDSVLLAVQNGSCDIAMAGLTVTPTRLESVDFADTYFNASQMVIAKSTDTLLNDSMTDAEVLNALKGKKIGVVGGYTGQFFVEGDEDFGFDGIEGATVTTYTIGATAVADLKAGQVDYVIIDNVPAQFLVANNAGTKLIDVPLTEEEYAFAIKKGNTELKNKVNEVLTKIKENGQLDQIIQKYFVGA